MDTYRASMTIRSERMSEAERLASEVEAAKLVKAIYDLASTIRRRFRPASQPDTPHVISYPGPARGEQS
jgi:hypothetical protein